MNQFNNIIANSLKIPEQYLDSDPVMLEDSLEKSARINYAKNIFKLIKDLYFDTSEEKSEIKLRKALMIKIIEYINTTSKAIKAKENIESFTYVGEEEFNARLAMILFDDAFPILNELYYNREVNKIISEEELKEYVKAKILEREKLI